MHENKEAFVTGSEEAKTLMLKTEKTGFFHFGGGIFQRQTFCASKNGGQCLVFQERDISLLYQ
jgi:hypothetical protein